MTLKFQDPGYVYIMSNESLNYLKIGYTQNSPYDRAAQLYDTGLPTPFTVEKFFFVEDAPQCEELVHMRLNRFRVNNEREFFRVDVQKAEMCVMQAIDDLRERLWAKGELKNDAKNESSLVVQYAYDNPKFKELIKVLKEVKRPLPVDDIATQLKISPKGVEQLLNMLASQEGKVLYVKEDNKFKKYSISLGFNVQQLTLMAEKYPALNLMELAPLFEKPKYNNNKNYNKKDTVPVSYENNAKNTNIEASKPAGFPAQQSKSVQSNPQQAKPVQASQKSNPPKNGSNSNSEPKKWLTGEDGKFSINPEWVKLNEPNKVKQSPPARQEGTKPVAAKPQTPQVKEFLETKIQQDDKVKINNGNLSVDEKYKVESLIQQARNNYADIVEQSKPKSSQFKPS